MSFLFSQPAPGILPANSVDFSEVETIGASTLLGNKLGTESTIQELLTSDVATMLNLSQYAVGAASSIANSIPLFSDSNGKILIDNSGWVIVGSVLRTLANGNGKVGSNTTRVGEAWFKDVLNLDSLSASQILASDASKNVVSLDTATYPSLTELSYVKGVTSAIQNQLNGKASTQLDNLGTTAINAHLLFNPDNTYDIGADGASRPSAIHAANHITTPLVRARDNDGLSQRHLTVRAGNSSMGNGDGGTLTVAAGLQNGSGTPGSLLLQSNGATRIELTSTGAINIPSLTASAFVGSNASKDLVSLSSSTATSYLDNFGGDLGAGGTKGLVPAPAAGDAAAGKYLKADGIWTAISLLPTQTGNQYKVLVTDGSTASWQYAGLGSGAFGTNNVILGRSKPSGQLVGAVQNVLIGTNAGNALTSAVKSVFIGYNAGVAEASGTENSFLGDNSGAVANGSSYNVGLGARSLLALSSGAANTALGWKALTGITTGGYNVGVGGQASANVSTASYTVGIGYNVLVGNFNSAIAIGNATESSGTNAICIGQSSSTKGSSCIVIGDTSYAGRGGGAQNITIGYQSGRSTQTGSTGADNIILGSSAGIGVSSGNRNILIGKYSGKYSSTQSDELFIDNYDRTDYSGQQTSSLIYGVFNATAASQTLKFNAATTSTYGLIANEIGGDYDSRIEGDTDQNLVFVDASTDKVGIGTATPQEKLDVGTGNARVSNGDLILNTAGNGLKIKEGSNAKMGVATLSSGSVTVSTTAVSSTTSRIFLTIQSLGTVASPKAIAVTTITNATSFVITSEDATDTSTVAWMIVDTA